MKKLKHARKPEFTEGLAEISMDKELKVSASLPDPCGCRKPSNCGSNNFLYMFAQALANRPKP